MNSDEEFQQEPKQKGLRVIEGGRGEQRELPRSIEAEEYLLSCCMLDSSVAARCLAAKIRPEHFYESKHSVVYETIAGLLKKNSATEPAIVAEELKTTRRLESVGGIQFLARLSSL